MSNFSHLNSVITRALLAGILFSGCDDPDDVQESDGVAILTNLNTGKKLLLENGEGETVVTSLSTRETLIAPGELAGVLTDEEYTALMPDESEDGMHGVSLPLAGGGATRWINVYAFYKSSTTSAIFCNVGSQPVRTIIKYQTDKATGRWLTIEIRRDGVLYGSQDVYATPSAQIFDRTWATTKVAGNFYVVIKKKGLTGDDIVSGYFNLNN